MALLTFAQDSCSQESFNRSLNKDSRYALALHNVFNFFDNNAYDEDAGVYWSEIDNQGQIVSRKVYNVALSRMIYGLSYANQLNPKYLLRAKSLVQLQLERLKSSKNGLTYFHSYIDFDNSAALLRTPEVIDIWQQSYGLNGLTELYRQTKDPLLLRDIHQLHDDFVTRFHDNKHGGFWAAINLADNSSTNKKSLQSLMYPLTAYMLNLWQADVLNGQKYQGYILENIQLAYVHGWNPLTQWVNMHFDPSWQITNEANSSLVVMPGHNFQLAALLLRGAKLPFVPAAQSRLWRAKALRIIDATMAKPIFDKERHSFYRTVNPQTNKILDHRKSWWQHAEAIIALSLDKRFEAELENLTSFFFEHFIDWSGGGEFFYLNQHNQPMTNELKGSIGKATYHTTEMIRYLNKNKYL